ncbi:MAG: DegV family protein [Clostridiales bacterium]|nr:DegV family protein [Clostridiales bacterium]
MKDYLLFMDVSGDIDANLAKEKNLKLIPMEFIIDDDIETYTADENGLDLVKFYENIKNKKIIKTSQINPNNYEEFFRPYMQQGYSALYLCLSSGLSATYQSSLKAAENLKKEFPNVDLISIDTISATAPMGLLAERMIANKEKGLSIEENAKDLNTAKLKLKAFAVVDDLNALKRGGRISAATAFFGSMLNIKPIIKLQDGKLGMIAKQKGIKACLNKLAELFKENYNPLESKTVYITDACENEYAVTLENLIKQIAPDCVVKRKLLSPIIGAHVGSGSVVIGFWGN